MRTIFGSARFYARPSRFTGWPRNWAAASVSGYAVMTGGGPGIMRGGQSVGPTRPHGLSIGCITLISSKAESLSRFSLRRIRPFLRACGHDGQIPCAFVVMPGGYGTLDEVFETLTLIQTGKPQLPGDRSGSAFGMNPQDFMQRSLIPKARLGLEEMGFFTVTDSLQEAVDIIQYAHCPAVADL